MIAILTESVREAGLLSALCDQRSWPNQTCGSVKGLIKVAAKITPRVMIVRHRLSDGYSDDVLAWLKTSPGLRRPHIIVLAQADCSIQQEARQVALGADCVLRDPLRLEVLLAYLAKYRSKVEAANPASPPPVTFEFAGAQVLPHEHHLTLSGKTVILAPQVIELLQLLHGSAGKVITYPILYNELFTRKFVGDTANCRVLLGKASDSFRCLGINLRDHVKVIPKSGYLYSPMTPAAQIPSRARQERRSRRGRARSTT